MDDVILFRTLERLVAVAIGGLCIWLGYRLFKAIPEQRDGEARIQFSGGISVYVARVGPGVFFALFGAAVLVVSLYSGITYQETSTIAGRPAQNMSQEPGLAGVSETREATYQGFNRGGTSVNDTRESTRQRGLLLMDIAFMNGLETDDLASRARGTSIKLELMEKVWAGDWGSWEAFQIWAEAGAEDPVPAGLESAVEYFRHGTKSEP
jgi:hypothetical protein